MWIKLRTTVTGIFFPSETLPTGAVISIGGPRGRKLVAAGKAIEVVAPASDDPDDVQEKREKYKEANPGPMWDEQPEPPLLPPVTASATEAAYCPQAAATLNAEVQRLLGPRSAAAFFAQERERPLGDPRREAQRAIMDVMGER